MKQWIVGTMALMLAHMCFAEDTRLAKEVFGYIKTPSNHQPESFGSYSRGCLAGAETLPESGPTWQAMRLSRNRNHGHPELIDFIKKLSKKARAEGWAGLYVGDLSQPRGGVMLSGHASHQIGLDADIWMLPSKRVNLTKGERENLSSISVVKEDFSAVNQNWTRAHHNILKAAAKDSNVARIFVTPAVKVQMCDTEGNRNENWLGKIRPWWGHNYHFHVRLKCQPGSSACENQTPVEKGSGCDYARQFLHDMLNPKPVSGGGTAKPKPRKTMAWLPKQCANLVQ